MWTSSSPLGIWRPTSSPGDRGGSASAGSKDLIDAGRSPPPRISCTGVCGTQNGWRDKNVAVQAERDVLCSAGQNVTTTAKKPMIATYNPTGRVQLARPTIRPDTKDNRGHADNCTRYRRACNRSTQEPRPRRVRWTLSRDLARWRSRETSRILATVRAAPG